MRPQADREDATITRLDGDALLSAGDTDRTAGNRTVRRELHDTETVLSALAALPSAHDGGLLLPPDVLQQITGMLRQDRLDSILPTASAPRHTTGRYSGTPSQDGSPQRPRAAATITDPHTPDGEPDTPAPAAPGERGPDGATTLTPEQLDGLRTALEAYRQEQIARTRTTTPATITPRQTTLIAQALHPTLRPDTPLHATFGVAAGGRTLHTQDSLTAIVDRIAENAYLRQAPPGTGTRGWGQAADLITRLGLTPDQAADLALCIDLLDDLTNMLHPRTSAVLRGNMPVSGRHATDDSHIGMGGPRSLLAPTTAWTRVTHPTEAVRILQPGETALILVSPRQGPGHATAAHHTDEGVYYIDPGAAAGQRVTTTPPLWNAAAAHAVIIGADGVLRPDALEWRSEAASTTQAIIDAPTDHRYGVPSLKNLFKKNKKQQQTPAPPTTPGAHPTPTSDTGTCPAPEAGTIPPPGQPPSRPRISLPTPHRPWWGLDSVEPTADDRAGTGAYHDLSPSLANHFYRIPIPRELITKGDIPPFVNRDTREILNRKNAADLNGLNSALAHIAKDAGVKSAVSDHVLRSVMNADGLLPADLAPSDRQAHRQAVEEAVLADPRVRFLDRQLATYLPSGRTAGGETHAHAAEVFAGWWSDRSGSAAAEATGSDPEAGGTRTRNAALARSSDGEPVRPLPEMLHRRARLDLLEQESGALGPDLFHLREHPEPPRFLRGFDHRGVASEGKAALMEALSMTHAAPAAAEMRPERFTGGSVLTVPAKAGGEPSQIPKVRYAIWLGSALGQSGGVRQAFRDSLTESTRVLAAEGVATVLLTDLPRAVFDEARTTPEPPSGIPDPLADVRSMLNWARAFDIKLVNVDEYFSSENPMELRAEYATEMAKQTGNGYAAASDILRLHLEFYIDGDDRVEPGLIEELEEAFSRGRDFAMARGVRGEANNNVIIAPSGHWFPRKYIEQIRENYTLTQLALYGEGDPEEGVGLTRGALEIKSVRTRRNSVMLRTGPDGMIEIPFGSPDAPHVVSAVGMGTGNSWFDRSGGGEKDAPPPPDPDEVTNLLVKAAATLVRDLYNRDGDLHLTQVASVVDRLPDPAAGWEALVGFIARTPQLAERVRTVTLYKLDMDNNPIRVGLPPAARRHLALDSEAAQRTTEGGLVTGEPEWVLGEIVQPARILPDGSQRGVTHDGDSSGHLVGPLFELAGPERAHTAPEEEAPTLQHGDSRQLSAVEHVLTVMMGDNPHDGNGPAPESSRTVPIEPLSSRERVAAPADPTAHSERGADDSADQVAQGRRAEVGPRVPVVLDRQSLRDIVNAVVDAAIPEPAGRAVSAPVPQPPRDMSVQTRLTLLYSLRDRLIPAGVAPGRTADDSVLHVRRQENRLAPGDGWRPVADWKTVETALTREGVGSTAFVLARRPAAVLSGVDRRPTDEGHAFAAHVLSTGELVWIDLQADADNRVSSAPPNIAPAEARAVVIAGDVRVVRDALPDFHASRSVEHSLLDPAANHELRGIGLGEERRFPSTVEGTPSDGAPVGANGERDGAPHPVGDVVVAGEDQHIQRQRAVVDVRLPRLEDTPHTPPASRASGDTTSDGGTPTADGDVDPASDDHGPRDKDESPDDDPTAISRGGRPGGDGSGPGTRPDGPDETTDTADPGPSAPWPARGTAVPGGDQAAPRTERRLGQTPPAVGGPFTAAALRDAAGVVIGRVAREAGVGEDAFVSDPTVLNCELLLAGLVEQLYPVAGEDGRRLPTRNAVRAAVALDDLAVGARRTEQRFARGPGWARVGSWESLAAEVERAGVGASALILVSKPSGKGHAFAMRHAVEGVLLVDLQAPGDRRVVADMPSVSVAHARAVVVDRHGQVIKDAVADWPPAPHTDAEALLDPPRTPDAFGAVSFEVEDLHPMSGADVRIVPGTVLAQHRLGQQVVADEHGFFRISDGRLFGSEVKAQAAAGKGQPVAPVVLPIPELVPAPLGVLPGETHRLPARAGIRVHLRTRELLRRSDREGRAIALRELLTEAEGWTVTPLGAQLSAHPSPEGEHHRAYTQFTVGVPIGGLTQILDLVDARLGRPDLAQVMAAGRSFADQLTIGFASAVLGQRVTPEQLPFLFGLAGADELHAYARLMFSHVSASPLQQRFWPRMLVKNMLPAAMRTPFAVAHSTLSPSVASFLRANEKVVVKSFERVLRQTAAHYRKRQPGPDDTQNILDETTWSGLKHRDYLIATTHGRTHGGSEVSQSETVGMKDYLELDTGGGSGRPMILIEVRHPSRDFGLDPRSEHLMPMNDQELEATFDLFAAAAHHAFVKAGRFQGGQAHGLSRAAAAVVLAHPLVVAAGWFFQQVRSLAVNGGRTVLPAPELRFMADVIAQHAAGAPLPPVVQQRLLAVRGMLNQALVSQPPMPAHIRPHFQQAVTTTDELLGLLAPRQAGQAGLATAPLIPLDTSAATVARRPEPVSAVENPVRADQWQQRRTSTPAVLSTERFVPMLSSTVDAAPDRGGEGLRFSPEGPNVLIRAEIQRVQADDGRWVRSIVLRRPVRTGEGFSEDDILPFQDRVNDLLNRHFNPGFRLPRSQDQLHIEVALHFDPDHAEAIELSRSAEPGGSDQLHIRLHTQDPTVDPAVSERDSALDDATALNEFLRYAGLGDSGMVPGSVFRHLAAQADAHGAMAGHRDLTTAVVPPHHLDAIEQVSESGPLLPETAHEPASPADTPPATATPLATDTTEQQHQTPAQLHDAVHDGVQGSSDGDTGIHGRDSRRASAHGTGTPGEEAAWILSAGSLGAAQFPLVPGEAERAAELQRRAVPGPVRIEPAEVGPQLLEPRPGPRALPRHEYTPAQVLHRSTTVAVRSSGSRPERETTPTTPLPEGNSTTGAGNQAREVRAEPNEALAPSTSGTEPGTGAVPGGGTVRWTRAAQTPGNVPPLVVGEAEETGWRADQRSRHRRIVPRQDP
ncbi:hypothetical protein [Streptomyces sp. NPDC007856]|uniref:hypothetical protein n=1 Tax=Streptomyces sp. NPDC007856 TaxID=3364781 RepID=UPI00367A3143